MLGEAWAEELSHTAWGGQLSTHPHGKQALDGRRRQQGREPALI